MHEYTNQFAATIEKQVNLNYLIYFPTDYAINSDRKFPLLMFLHGIGERGTDIEKVKTHGLKEILAQPNLPFVIVCPQCPDGSSWATEIDALNHLVDHLTHIYQIDKRRMYLTGLSMGGYGTWDFALQYPEKFAAIAPICGGTLMLEDVSKVKNLPIWTFHGEKDRRIPIEGTKKIVSILKQLGSNIRVTYYPEVGHNAWIHAYSNPELYEWLLSFERREE